MSLEDQDVTIYFEDLIRFLAERRPNQKCSVCGQDEGWRFHAEAKPKEKNPRMTIFEVPLKSKPGERAWIDSVCIECPNCATLNFLGAASIADFTDKRAKKDE